MNAATLKESPAKGDQHFDESAMKGQISPENQLFDQKILQPGMWKKEINKLKYLNLFYLKSRHS